MPPRFTPRMYRWIWRRIHRAATALDSLANTSDPDHTTLSSVWQAAKYQYQIWRVFRRLGPEAANWSIGKVGEIFEQLSTAPDVPEALLRDLSSAQAKQADWN